LGCWPCCRADESANEGDQKHLLNSSGNWFSPDYGFGFVGADAFTTAAGLTVAVAPLQLEHTSKRSRGGGFSE
jgi:hypothetical protein